MLAARRGSRVRRACGLPGATLEFDVDRDQATRWIPHEPNFVRDMKIVCSARGGEPNLLMPGNALLLTGSACIPQDWSYLTKRIYRILPATVMVDVFDHAVMIAMELLASVAGSWRFVGWDAHCTPVIARLKTKHFRLCPRDQYLHQDLRFTFRTSFSWRRGNAWGRAQEAELYSELGQVASLEGSVFTFVKCGEVRCCHAETG